ncbi:MAG: S9 family peptidase [Flavobacteriales bacterium]|nr:S9 family peptidase [Flavobacteriales bacterium]
MKRISLIILVVFPFSLLAQVMTPEKLWQLGRISAKGISSDGKYLVYSVTTPNIAGNTFDSKTFAVEIATGNPYAGKAPDSLLDDPMLSADGKHLLLDDRAQVRQVKSSDLYKDLDKSEAMIYDDLHYRHWDEWDYGDYNHVMIKNQATGEVTDLLKGMPYHTPTVPFGGSEDYTWSADGSRVVYVCKKLFGTEYVNSTNTDLYSYDVTSRETTNLTEANKGYDTHPVFSEDGRLAYLCMQRDGYEADKNDIKVFYDSVAVNLTEDWFGTVREFIWSEDSKKIYFTAAIAGTVQLFELTVPSKADGKSEITQITEGQFDMSSLVGQVGKEIICGRNDMNHAREYYAVSIKKGEMRQLTSVNTGTYSELSLPEVKKRMVATTDGKEMVTWVIYPPDFDPAKKYPTLLYTQGGPQSALSQFYSFRWNFQIMASQGYIVVAPNRRGMPGYGVEWNENISKDWGGQVMDDYLAAIDDVAKEPYVDNDRLGCVGASYGGYSAFFLAGIHKGRFKSFIAHDGVFNLESMYGTTEELFFVNWDLGGPYWDKSNVAAQKSYETFNPKNYVANWDTPMLIIQGGRDYRVPIGQSLEAFTVAQQKGIKSRLLYLPDENHWVLSPQNGLVWQREFFKWLDETVKNSN